MSPWTFVALAGAAAVAALPTRSSARVAGLAGSGRIGATAGPRPGRWARAVARPSPALATPVALGAAAVLAVVLAVVAGPALAIAASVVVATALLLVRDAVRRRAAERSHGRLLTAVRVLAGELAAGSRPADALVAAAATAEPGPLVAAAAVAAAGGDPGPVLADDAEAGVRALGTAWRLVTTSGAALAEVVERVAADLAAGDARRRAVAVALAGPRASALMLSGLPAVGVGLGVAMGARPVEFLLGDPVGRLLCCAGVVLDAAGILWIRAIVGRVERA